ncbi:LCP family protein [Actinoallomurus sp. CA-150999]|uniref:LCP family protein n=1 Tax=Actinoallomurus sp. CA-150999 TaxID=3239887 RepID=UPI003D9071A3
MSYGQKGLSRSAARARRRSPARARAGEGYRDGEVRRRPVRRRLGPVGIVCYALTCIASVLVLVASGVGYFVLGRLHGLGTSHAIQGPKSKGGAVNILLIGLDSRKDQNGNDLPEAILSQLHAGSKRGVDNGVGGYNTNTLILLHVPNDGSRATAFSIPRDDYVTYTDAIGTQQQGKIKEAYGVTKYFREVALSKQGVHGSALEHQGREAGRKATIATVRKLTGVPIDHFAEINLAGFYDLATALGGVEVCLKHPVNDSFSGADFPAGRQHLNGSQALAFVRQRHGLTNGDLDRTHRQQAFLSSATHQLRKEGVFGDLGKMGGLLNVAKKDVVLDAGWDVVGFAQQAQNLTGGNVEFHTLPIERYGLVHGQDVNIIDPVKVKTIVRSAFSSDRPKPASTGTPGTPTAPLTVDVHNGGGKTGLAARIADRLSGLGYTKGDVRSINARNHTIVRYGTGARAAATKIARYFGVTAAPGTTVAAGHIEIDLGKDATMPSVPAGNNHPAPTRPAAIPTEGAQGGAVAGGGIPCVN